MTDGAVRMVFLGFGKWARADRIYALEPITGDERGGGRRTRVWVEGITDPILAGRTERTILHDMGQDSAARERVIAAFERESIGYNRYLPSIHLQPYMRERFGFREGLCPVAEDVSSRSLALPFFTGIDAAAQERVADVLASAL